MFIIGPYNSGNQRDRQGAPFLAFRAVREAAFLLSQQRHFPETTL
jgi:hypothetical protein